MTALALKPVAEMDAFAADFAAHSAGLPGAGLAWLDARRRAAMAGQPSAWGSVGPAGKRRSNQARTAGWNVSRGCIRLPEC
jgi:hypothetical protein